MIGKDVETHEVEEACQWIHVLHHALVAVHLDNCCASMVCFDELFLRENLHDIACEEVHRVTLEV